MTIRILRCLITVCCWGWSVLLRAVPADTTPMVVSQPDGSPLTLLLHGDEWCSFYTTEDGYTVVQDSAGYYVYARREGDRLVDTRVMAHDAAYRQTAERMFLAAVPTYIVPGMPVSRAKAQRAVERRRTDKGRAIRRDPQLFYNHFRGLVILVEFNDRKFSRTDCRTLFRDMVNKEHYTGYDQERYTGSVRDYFYDNSSGKMNMNFDVYGPYTIDFSQYDARYEEEGEWKNRYDSLSLAAVCAADAEVDFSRYDGDGDGLVDMIYFIFAGNSSDYSGNDRRLVWPHHQYITQTSGDSLMYVYKDGVCAYEYACSAELRGWTARPESVKINGIGTMCHEFGHALGLPDFYDVYYHSGSPHPKGWSVMATGTNFNQGRTPVGYSLYERWAVGFCDAPQILSSGGYYMLPPLCREQCGFRINTPIENEYFLLENRQKDAFKWDAYLPGSGLLVHRVEWSDSMVWLRNEVNADPLHQYYEVIRANGIEGKSDGSEDVFPARGKTELGNRTLPAHLRTWDGQCNDLELSEIMMRHGIVFFRVTEHAFTDLPQVSVSTVLSEPDCFFNQVGQREGAGNSGIKVVKGRKICEKW